VAAFCKKLNLVRRLSERSFTSGGFPKEAPEVPEGSNLFLNVLREASPLAAFRRKRTSFGKLHLWRLSERSFTSGASFGKLHLWRGGGFPKEAEGSELVLKKARPSASSRRKGVLRLPPEGRASSRRKGVLPKEGRPPEGRASFASFGKLHLWRGGASFGKLHLWRFLRKDARILSETSTSFRRKRQR